MRDSALKLIGPFRQLLTMNNLPKKGAIKDEELEVINNAGVLSEDGIILKVGPFESLCNEAVEQGALIEHIDFPAVCIPGLVDVHTHICWGGSRARDYAMRIAGKSYLEIAKQGGGIQDTVRKTRAATPETLGEALKQRALRHLMEGVTTCEVKSGYGLNVDDELKMLRAINAVDQELPVDLIPTCLAAHMKPADFEGRAEEYLDYIAESLLPVVKQESLANRVDIFVEESAFSVDQARTYLRKAKELGFSLTIHGDQFTPGSSLLACELEALSVDHLESSTEREIQALAKSNVTSVALPGASMGLGMAFAPARKLLDQGAALAISTDWNPGSAPMGDLLLQAAVLGAAEKLSMAETLAGITVRAAKALGLDDRGVLATGKLADFIAFPCDDYREILYQQGKIKPVLIRKQGNSVTDS